MLYDNVVCSAGSIFYDAGIQKLAPRYDKCLNNGVKYIEK
jgi:hypothetical protein